MEGMVQDNVRRDKMRPRNTLHTIRALRRQLRPMPA
jgi:hypothetical protein